MIPGFYIATSESASLCLELEKLLGQQYDWGYCIHTVPFQILPPPVTLLQEKCIGGRVDVVLVLSVLANDSFLSTCCWSWVSGTSDALGVSLGWFFASLSFHAGALSVLCCTLIPIATRGPAYHACFLSVQEDKRLQAFSPCGLRSELIPFYFSMWQSLEEPVCEALKSMCYMERSPFQQ